MVSENAQNTNSAHTMELQDIPNDKKSRYKKLFLWSLGLIILIILIIIIVVSVSGDSKKSEKLASSSKITLDDIIQLNTFYSQDFNGTWISDMEILYRDADENVILYNTNTRNKTILLKREGNLFLNGASNIEISPDRKYLLIERITRKIYRYSYLAEYVIVNLKTNAAQQLIHKNDKEFQLAIWSPTNSSLVYVKDNNIYYIPTFEVSDYKYYPITTDGVIGVIYNGVPDWVYEEEVFADNKVVLWFSPDGKQLAFIKFNDSLTRIMPIPFYGLPGDLIFQYPLEQHIRYPKAGTPNPSVELIVVNLEELNENTVVLKHMNVPKLLIDRQPILSVVSWVTNETLIAVWMNREQYLANVVLYDIKKPDFEVTITSIEEHNGWVEMFTPPIIAKNGSYFIMKNSHNQGNGTGNFTHVTLYETKENATPIPLTKGKFVVTDILKWDEQNSYVYYLSNTENDPAVRHLSRVSTQNPFQTECITCNLTSSENPIRDNDICLYNNADFSKESSYFAWSCSGPSVPFSSIYKTNNLSEILTWESNKNVQKAVAEKEMPQIERFKVAVNDKFEAQVKLLLPSNMDKSGRTKYPMLVKVYAGPGSFQVVERFSVDWESYLVSSKNIIVAYIDGRGSGLKGDNMRFANFRKLGTVEIYDQINVTRYIQEQFNYVDPKHTAIWGWSYGGYATGMALALDKRDVFKCGISVGPVTDWALYDSIYTERYMGLPRRDDNLDGYIKAQLLNKVEGLRNKTYFLVHGTMDDNVHYQQAMMLSKKLERSDIMFRQLTYPDENHGLFGVRKHLYHNLEDFLDNCFEISNKKDC